MAHPYKRRRLAAFAGLTLAVLVAFVLYLRRDVTADILRVRGAYAGARVLSTWEEAGGRYREVELDNDRGEAVATAYVCAPAALVTPYRAVVTYVGATTGRKILGLIPPARDRVLVAVQYPFTRPRGLLAYLRAPYDIRHAVYRAVAGGMLALDYLPRAGLAPARVTVLGASVGTPFAVLHAALDPRVTSVLLVHGGGDLARVVWTLERHGKHPWRAPLTAAAAELFAASFDPVRYVDRIAPRPLTILASRQDPYFPVASAQDLYDRARRPKRLLWTSTGHVGARKLALVAAILATLDRQLAEDDPLPRATRAAS